MLHKDSTSNCTISSELMPLSLSVDESIAEKDKPTDEWEMPIIRSELLMSGIAGYIFLQNIEDDSNTEAEKPND